MDGADRLVLLDDDRATDVFPGHRGDDCGDRGVAPGGDPVRITRGPAR